MEVIELVIAVIAVNVFIVYFCRRKARREA